MRRFLLQMSMPKRPAPMPTPPQNHRYAGRGRQTAVTVATIFTPSGRQPTATTTAAVTVAHARPDPLDACWDRFCPPKRKHEVIDLDETDVDMVETARNDQSAIDLNDLTLLDQVSALETTDVEIEGGGETGLVMVHDVEEEEEIICLDDKEQQQQGASSRTDGGSDRPAQPVRTEEEEEEIVVVQEKKSELNATARNGITDSALTATSSRTTTAITNADRHVAAMEDSLVKGTMQQFQQIIRQWEVVKSLRMNLSVRNTVIRVCTYNILCQETIAKTRYLYKHLTQPRNEYPLFWENRWRLLKQNLEHISADIFALQEVQDTHFQTCINPLMSSMGYSSMWTPKTEGFGYRDGCALFYRNAKFEYIFARKVEYYCGEKTSLDKPQIGQILRLRCRVTGKDIIVANTHIIFNMKRGDIKLGQLAMLFANIHQEMKDHGEAPLILMGDFNMDRVSHLYRFVVQGSVFLKGLPRSALAWERDPTNRNIVDAEAILPQSARIGRDSMFLKHGKRPVVATDTISHPFNLWTAHAPLPGRSSVDEISTYHEDYGNPDFIFYSVAKKDFNQVSKCRTVHESKNLRLYRRVTLPSLLRCAQTLGPWPNAHVPSDHIPLIAEFQLRGDS